MRIGQILQEAGLVTQQQLEEGLKYSAEKGIFLGRAFILLKFLSAESVDTALVVQKLIKIGLSPRYAVEALQTCLSSGIPLEQALQDRLEEKLFKNAKETPDLPDEEVGLEDDQSVEGLIRNGDKLLIKDFCSEAAEYYQKARQAQEKALGETHIELVPVIMRLANTYLALHDFEKAQAHYEKVLSIRQENLQENHPELARTYQCLADLYRAQGEEEQAMKSSLSALDVLEQNLPGQLSAYASLLQKLAAASQAKAVPSEKPIPVGELLKNAELLSERELQTALKMSKQMSQPLGVVLRENCMIGDRDLQSALKAQYCIRQGMLSEELAANLLARASRRDISLERLLHEAGVFAMDERKYEVYRQIAKDLDALVANESSAVGAQQNLAPIAFRLGTSYEQLGDITSAEVYYARALKIWESDIQSDLRAAKTCYSLSKIYHSQGRLDASLQLLQKALEFRKKHLGENHEDSIDTMEEIADAAIAMLDYRTALPYAQQAAACREELGQMDSRLFRAILLTADCQAKLKEFDAAQASYRRAMNLAQSRDDKPTLALAAVTERLADLYGMQKMLNLAMPMYKSALMIHEGTGNGDSENAQSLRKKIAEAEAAKST